VTTVLPKVSLLSQAFRACVRPLVRRNNNTGIRIEDDYLITERELEWISRAPRKIAELEGVMRHPAAATLRWPCPRALTESARSCT